MVIHRMLGRVCFASLASSAAPACGATMKIAGMQKKLSSNRVRLVMPGRSLLCRAVVTGLLYQTSWGGSLIGSSSALVDDTQFRLRSNKSPFALVNEWLRLDWAREGNPVRSMSTATIQAKTFRPRSGVSLLRRSNLGHPAAVGLKSGAKHFTCVSSAERAAPHSFPLVV